VKRKTIIAPWEPLEIDEYDIRSIKAVAAGTASDTQQQHAFKVIVNKFCGTYDQSFRPGVDGQRATDFAEGKRFVGNRIVHTIKRTIPEKP
jgi:hypothetical protein